MRNKISGPKSFELTTGSLSFQHHKYYSPQNPLEEEIVSKSCFMHTVAENKGFFVAICDKHTKIFAVKFTPGACEFPFISFIENTLYKDGFLFLGTDTKKQAFFKPVF